MGQDLLVFAFLLFVSIVLITVAVRLWPRDFDKYTDDILFQSVLNEVCAGMQSYEVYTAKGALRASVHKRVMNLMPSERAFLDANQDAFRKLLQDKNLLTSDNKIKKSDLKDIVAVYDGFKKTYLTRNTAELRENGITPEDFFQLRRLTEGDAVGAYVILNETKNMYYVGQAKRLFFRVNQHFTGHGNGDVYADYKYGDSFKIKLIELADSGYSDIDRLEKDLIRQYHAYSLGYNRTHGNG